MSGDRPWREELNRRIPNLSEEAFAGILASYSFARGARGLPPREVRDELDKMATKLWQLAIELRALPNEARDWLNAECERAGAPRLLREVDASLEVLGGACEMGRREVEKQAKDGRPVAPLTRLIRGLARALHEIGLEPDSKRNGPLVQATAIALHSEKVSVANIDATVSSALKSWVDKPW